MSRLIEWFLYADSDWITFGLIINLLCVLRICWVSMAVVLVKNNVLFLVLTGKLLGLGFPNDFNKSSMKCGKIVSYLMQYLKNMGNDQKPKCSSCIVIEHHNFKIFIISPTWLSRSTTYWKNPCNPCYCFLTPQYQNFTNPPSGIFLG